MKRYLYLVVLVVMVFSLLASLSASAASLAIPSGRVVYDVISMPANFWARAINNHGQVAGRTADGHAAIWSVRGGLELVTDADWSEAFDINDQGTVLISATWNSPPRSGFYLVHRDGLVQKIDMPTGTYVHGLNNANQVIGEYNQSGFIWDNCSVDFIVNKNCTMAGINDHGAVTGFIWGYGGGEQPFVWHNDQLTLLELPNEETEGRPASINNAGCIAGYINMIDGWGAYFPVVWNSAGSMRQLGNLHGKASCINNRGEVLGYVEPPGSLYQATLWRPDGSSFFLESRLNKPLRILYTTLQMNDAGQIICYSYQSNPPGNGGYFFLQPRYRR